MITEIEDGMIFEDSDPEEILGLRKTSSREYCGRGMNMFGSASWKRSRKIKRMFPDLSSRYWHQVTESLVLAPSTQMRTILEVKEFARTEQPYYMEPFKDGWSKHYCERKDIWMKPRR